MKELTKNMEELNRKQKKVAGMPVLRNSTLWASWPPVNALTYFWKKGRLSNLINW